MCKAPQTLADGTIVGCRNCSQCLGRAVDDWSGRCIAESKFATAPFFVALTYGRELDERGEQVGSSDHLRALLLTYSDVQKYMKRFRASGYRPRYFAVGEYGSFKGRAHWHLLIFWQDNAHVIAERKQHNADVLAKRKRGKVRPVPDGPIPDHVASTRDNPKRFMEAHWKHGWSTWEPLGGSTDPDDFGTTAEDTAAAVRYVCKYLYKDFGEAEKQAMCRMSKKPLLGAAWIHERARLHVDQGLAPQDLFYSFPDVADRQGNIKQFMLRPGSAAADLFCQSYLDQWAAAHEGRCTPLLTPEGQIYAVWGERCTPPSALIDEYSDRLAAPLLEADKWQSVVEKKEAELQAMEERRRRFVARHQWGTNYHWDVTRQPSRHGPSPLQSPISE